MKTLFTIIIVMLVSQSSVAEDWPMFRHDLEHSGETSDVIENPEDLELKWEFETRSLIRSSSPAVSGDYLYIGSGYSLYCVDKNTGELIWEFETEVGYPVESSPAVSGNYVYFGSQT